MKNEGLLEQMNELNNNINMLCLGNNRKRRSPFTFRSKNDYKLNDGLFKPSPINNNDELKRNNSNICIDNNINLNIINKNANFDTIHLHNGYHSTKGFFKPNLIKSSSMFF